MQAGRTEYYLELLTNGILMNFFVLCKWKYTTRFNILFQAIVVILFNETNYKTSSSSVVLINTA